MDAVGSSEVNELATLSVLTGRKVRERKEGESFLEAIERELAEPGVVAEDEGWEGPVAVRDVDLFHGSRQAWRRTNGGYRFLPTGSRWFVLHEEAAGWAVTYWSSGDSSKGRKSGSGFLAREVPDLPLAMALAEAEISDDEQVYAGKKRAWHKRKASEAQLKMAGRLKLSIREGARQGEVSEMIDVALVSRLVDRRLNDWTKTHG